MTDLASKTGLRKALMIGGAIAFAATLLSACNTTPVGFPGLEPTPAPPVASGPASGGATVGETLGAGPVRVGLILPLTQASGPSPLGASLRNGAALALEESGSNDITLMMLDDHSTPEGSGQAAQSAIGAGAEIIVGPVFAADVREAGKVARAAGRPMIAFSTDVSVAG